MKVGWKSGLRPLIGLDGTFLKDRIKGQLLVAVGQNSMNQFYPIAWAMVEKETTKTWSWFVELLKRSLDLKDGSGVAFISDMQKVYHFLNMFHYIFDLFYVLIVTSTSLLCSF